MSFGWFSELKRIIRTKQLLLLSVFTVAFSAFSLCAGFLSKEGRLQSFSYLVSDSAISYKAKSIGISVSPSNPLENDMSQYRNYCTNQNNAYYSTEPFQCFVTYNANKDKHLDVIELGDGGKNVSCLTLSSFSIHKDTKERNILDSIYLEVYYPKSNTSFLGEYDNFVYISDIQARYLRDEVWHIDHKSNDDFSGVIDKTLSMSQGSKTYTWKISNVYKTNYRVFEVANDMFGNFLVAYSYVPDYNYNPFEMTFAFQGTRYLTFSRLKDVVEAFNYKNYSFNVVNIDNAVSNEKIQTINSKLNDGTFGSSAGFYILAVFACLSVGVLFAINLLSTKVPHIIYRILLSLVPICLWGVVTIFSKFVFGLGLVPYASMGLFFVLYLITLASSIIIYHSMRKKRLEND